MTTTELEALVVFLRDRQELWRRHAVDFGCENPDQVVLELTHAHHKAVAESMEEQP